MSSQSKQGWIYTLFFFIFIISFLTAYPAFSQEPGVESESEVEGTSTHVINLGSQQPQYDLRSSLWGGTGIIFTRTAILLPRKTLTLSDYFIFSHYGKLQGYAGKNFDDPRMNDYEMNLVGVYGLTPYLELSAFINVFLENEDNDPKQLHMRGMGIGQSGLDLKIRLMDFYRTGMGITVTPYLRFPSPQQGADTTSGEVGYGGELNVSLHLKVIRKWLDKLILHGSLGYGHFDYFDTGLAGFYQSVKKDGTLALFAANPGKFRGDYYYSDLLDPNWTADDIEMKKLWIPADHITGSLAVELRPYKGLSMGFELAGYRMMEFKDDNLQLMPFLTYTMVELPFSKRVHKDVLTIYLAGNIGMRENYRSAPQYGVVTGLSYHTDLKF